MQLAQTLRRVWRATLTPAALPAYPPLSVMERARINIEMAGRFFLRRECRDLTLCCILWLLAGHHLVWMFDVQSVWRLAPWWSAGLWMGPWLADARHRYLRHLVV